jgi:1-aminocyclopropane-1-carboxylate deaminase
VTASGSLTHFGGFAKVSDELIRFMRDFYTSTNIRLDPIYSSKAAYAMVELAHRKKDNNPENWVLIHTGGLQGLSGMEEKLGFEIY